MKWLFYIPAFAIIAFGFYMLLVNIIDGED